ncbi:DUF1573 domain-containing protein [Bacteroides faecium]|uniref:DUF1573 domain-containing protein n=1 Tax=Bacteroides faecium TaxID=2715212 RepID=A0A6H0KS65_9BACE|nr:DUF1573 domain-containing protein [Bacteroides faecium]QIU96202.1 DUF1573 domain-containing protein [Bacteroides faecium]
MKYIVFCILLFMSISCIDSKQKKIVDLIREWESKEIVFPINPIFTIGGKDTVNFQVERNKYKIVVYVDSVGCTSCKLRLLAWKGFMAQIDSLSSNTVQFLYFIYPKNKMELSYNLMVDNFRYPVCFDEKDSLNKLNHFPGEMMFHTFLLDRANKVLAVGNPVYNQKIKKLYLDLILGREISNEKEELKTTAILSASKLDMGAFEWHYEQIGEFILTNSGNKPLIINEVVSSCGCTVIEYSSNPIQPRDSIKLKVRYKAEHPEYFNKTITVYCNAENAPFKLKISGNAK